MPFPDKYSGGQFRIDGFDPNEGYQMVPLKGTRTILVTTGPGPCFLSVDNGLIASMENFRAVSDAPLPNSRPGRMSGVKLPEQTAMKVDLFGEGVGLTGLTLESGRSVEFFKVSVKAVLPVTYRVVFLKDPIRPSVEGKIDPDKIMDGVKAIFLSQANIEFREVLPKVTATINADLQNPVVTGDEDTFRAILRDTGASVLNSARIILFCVWNVESRKGETDTTAIRVITTQGRNVVFVEVPDGRVDAPDPCNRARDGARTGSRSRKRKLPDVPQRKQASNILLAGDIEVVNPLP